MKKQLNEEQLLRKHIRKAIDLVIEKKNTEKNKMLVEEQKLRKIIRKLIESEKPEATPHASTGINVLEDLLKKIIPVIEVDYKQLTTDPGQRESFRAHILNAVQNALAPENAIAGADGEEVGELNESRRQDSDALEFALDREGQNKLVIKRSVKPYDVFVIAKNSDGTYNIFMDPDQLKLIDRNVDREKVLRLAKTLDYKWWEIYSDYQPERPPLAGRRGGDTRRGEDTGRRGGEDRRKRPRGDVMQGSSTGIYKALDDRDRNRSIAEEVDINVGDNAPEDDEAFIDIDSKPEAVPTADPKDDFGLEGEEVTGRNFAFTTFQKVENQIVDSYSLLDNAADRSLFFDYLVTNLKLYFDKFEDELRARLEEPTTPEYEQEKGQQLGPEI